MKQKPQKRSVDIRIAVPTGVYDLWKAEALKHDIAVAALIRIAMHRFIVGDD